MAHWLAVLHLWLVLIAVPTLMFPGPWTGVGAVLISLGFAGRWLDSGRPSVPTPLDFPIALLALTVVMGAMVSSVPEASASKLWGVFLGIALYYALANSLVNTRWQQRAVGSLLAVGVGLAGVALVGTDWSYAGVVNAPWLDAIYGHLPVLLRGLPGSGLPTSTGLFNPREVGGTLSLLLPVAGVMLWHDHELSWPWRAALAAAAVVMSAVLLLSQTVSAVGGVAAAFWAAALISDRPRRIWWLAGGFLVIVVMLMALWIGKGSLGLIGSSAGDASLFPSGREHAMFGLASRLELWPRALQMVHDTPYTGIGLNTFPWVMDRFYSGYALGPEPHAHNFLLQTAVDLGLLGAVALLWLLATFALTLRVCYLKGDETSRILILALAAGVFAFLLFGVTDAVTLGAKPGIVFWAILGIAMAHSRSVSDGTGRVQHGYPWLNRGIVLMVVGALVVPVAWDGPRLNAGRLIAYRAFLPAPVPSDDRTAMSRAISFLAPASQTDPDNSGTWYLLGSLQSRLGDTAAALASLREAVMLDSHDPLRRYALPVALSGVEDESGWEGLLRVYAQWTARYPQRAEWYVATAMALCEGKGNQALAQQTLERAVAQGADPRSLVEGYRTEITAANRCSG